MRVLPLLCVVLGACGGGASESGAGTAAPRTPDERSTSYDRTFAEADVQLGQSAVTFEAWVIGTAGGCLDVVCETESGCCGTCTGEAYFAGARNEPDIDRAMFMFAAEGIELGEGFGACHDDDECNIVCNPPAGGRYEVEGTLRRTHGLLAVGVQRLRRLAE